MITIRSEAEILKLEEASRIVLETLDVVEFALLSEALLRASGARTLGAG